MISRVLRSKSRFLASNRRSAAVHEAGHVVVAHHLGVSVQRSWIWPATEGNPWRGQTLRESTSPEKNRLIAVGGPVAVTCWFDKAPSDWRDAMSPSDWRSAGCEPDEPDNLCIAAAKRVERMLRRGGLLWPELIREARAIIVASRTPTH